MIELKKITQQNYKTCIALTTTPAQENFVATNWYSLLESLYEENRYAWGIYTEDVMIGFLMFSYYPADETYSHDSWWIERLMIDQRCQNKGYGKKALMEGIAWFAQTIGEKELRISAVKTNAPALHLYEQLHFVRTGEEIEGETVLLKQIK